MRKNRQKLSFFTKLMLVINGGVALALLIAYLAPIIDPRTFWPVAFFGLAYPPLLLLNVLFIVFWCFVRARLALLSVITVVIGFNVLLNNIGFSFFNNNNPRRLQTNLRILTYNVHSFKKYGEEEAAITRHSILKTMDEIDPDVIGIQEFFSRKRGAYAMNDSITDLIGTPYRHFEPSFGNEHEAIGLCIFSRFPIVSKGSVEIGPLGSGNQCIYADVKKDDRIIRFYSAHLQSIRFEPQDYQYLDTVTKKGKADISSTRRLAVKLKQAFLKRAEQVVKIREHASQCPYPYIISGDFNDTPTSFAVNQMAKGMQNTFREKGFGLGRTYNGDFPNYQIDYIMATNQFNVLSYNIVQKKLSDHYPVYTDLVLK